MSGNDDIYADGKYLKLADKLKTLMNGKAFPSVDYIVGEDLDYNAYYDFYGTPKLKKLNINLSVDKLSDANLENMCKMIRQLKPIQQDILAYSWPISIIYRNGLQDIAVADFSNSSFTDFLKSEDNSQLEKYCTVMLIGNSEQTAAGFYNIKTVKTEEQVTKDIANLIMTQTVY